jgi:hypothetical protein
VSVRKELDLTESVVIQRERPIGRAAWENLSRNALALLASGQAVAGLDIKPSTLAESCCQLNTTNESEMKKLVAQTEGIIDLSAVMS